MLGGYMICMAMFASGVVIVIKRNCHHTLLLIQSVVLIWDQGGAVVEDVGGTGVGAVLIEDGLPVVLLGDLLLQQQLLL